jgi:hypothetical protein
MPDIVPGTGAPVNGGGLANFNPDAAAQNLAAVGQPPPPQGPPVPVEARPAEGPPVPAGLPVPVAPPPGTLPVSPTGNPTSTPTPAAPVADPSTVGRQALGDMQAAHTDEAKAADDVQKAQQDKAEADAKVNDAQAAEIRKRQEDADRQQQASDSARARLVAIADKADSDVANFKHVDYEDSIPASKKIRLIIGAALSGLGGATDPMAQINKNIAQHFEREKAELTSKENFAKAKRGGVDDFDRHVNDQRMYLEFREHNYREAMAKEIEAQGLRSGKPVIAAKAKEMAAQARGIDADKVGIAVERFQHGEEARAHAALFASKARAAGKGGGGGKNAAESDLADAAQAGKPYNELVKIALRLHLKDPRKAATEALTGAEKDQQSIFTDPGTGKQYRVPSGRGGASKIADEFAANESYVNAVEAFAKHIEENGRILNPLSDEGKMRASLAADVQSKGRQVQGIQASDAGAKLEHMVIGGTGTGFSSMASPEVLRRLAKEASDKTATKMRASLTPLPGRDAGARGGEGSAPAAPKVPAAVIDAAKAEVKANGPHVASARKLLDQQGITVL